jgi:predicted DCC family thiol-disulfide oxidoreductase YuxK
MSRKNKPQEPRREGKWVFYYDGECGFCIRAVGWLYRLDLFKRVDWIPYQSLDKPPQGLTWDDLEASVYLDTGRGPLYPGFYAVRMLTLKVALLVPLAPLFWFPGVHVPGVALYHWVARNRHRLSAWRIPGISPGRPPQPPGH